MSVITEGKLLKTVCFYRKDAGKFAYVHIFLNAVTDKVSVDVMFRKKYERSYYLLTYPFELPKEWAVLVDIPEYKELIALNGLNYSQRRWHINNTLTDCKGKYIIREVQYEGSCIKRATGI